MGLFGAAVATNIGRAIGVIYQVYHLVKGNGVIRIRKRISKPDITIIRGL